MIFSLLNKIVVYGYDDAYFTGCGDMENLRNLFVPVVQLNLW